MPDETNTQTAPPQQPQGTPGKIVAAGPATAGTPKFFNKSEQQNQEPPPAGQQQNAAPPDPNNAGAGNAAAGAAGAAGATENQNGAGAQGQNQLPDLSDEQLEQVLKARGVTLPNGIAGLNGQQQKPEPTAEEKAAAELAIEKRMLDHYTKHGGTVEQFVQMKQIAAMDLKDLSEAQIRNELKGEGFNDAQINSILVERYYQLNPDELQQGDEESDEDFNARKELVKKKVAYGAKKLQSSFSHIQQATKNGLQQLRDALAVEDQLAEQEAALVSTVDAIAKELPRKITFPLGKVNDQEVPPVEFEVSDAHVAAVVETLKDPSKRNQLLFNQDNSLNVQSLANLILRNQILEDALKAGYLDGGHRQVEAFEKIFPGRTAQSIGVGGNSQNAQGRKGHVVSAGAPVPANFPSTK